MKKLICYLLVYLFVPLIPFNAWAVEVGYSRVFGGEDFVTQDFTAFTEVDPGSDVTVDSSTKISWVNLQRSNSAYVYYDYGAGHFNEDATHRFIIQKDNTGSGGLVVYWCVGSELGDRSNLNDGMLVQSFNDNLVLAFWEDGSGIEDTYSSMSDGTVYYVTVTRDYDGGTNSTGRLTGYIRTGSHTGTLVDTLQVDASVGEQNDYRYLYGMQGLGIASGIIDGYTETMEIKGSL